MELIKKKMEIANRAGNLEKEINELSATKLQVKKCIETQCPLYVKIEGSYMETSGRSLRTKDIEPNGHDLHKALIVYLDQQIEKRTKELDELIKVLV